MRLPRTLLASLALAATGCTSAPPAAILDKPGEPAAPVPEASYLLPFQAGTCRRCIQAGPGPFSHSGTMRYAIDFAMPVGTPVLAARRGRVASVKEDSDVGGMSKAYAAHGNRVVIDHDDGTRAVYLHLRKDGAAVEVGQQVERGEVIGYSGNTGWSALPHLHFQVDRRQPESGRWCSIPVRFADVAGDGVPSMLTVYESANRACAARAGPLTWR